MDKVTPAARSANMRRIRSSGTSPEAKVASALKRLGVRYTRKASGLPGKPDFVLLDRGQLLMVHGCFWHQHERCREGRVPASNVDYWKPKLLRNVRRDAVVARRLRRQGWSLVVVWECELNSHKDSAQLVRAALNRGARTRVAAP